LTGAEQRKWKFGRKKPQQDAFDVLGINPLNEYKVRVWRRYARTGN
jgi:small subunit ribosomal protein S18